MRVFFDTKVLVHLFDRHEPVKQQRARTLFQKRATDGSLLLSTQLQEFYVTVTRKLSEPLGEPEASAALRHLTASSGVCQPFRSCR